MGVKVDGSKVRLFGSKTAAHKGAKSIGWPVGCATRVETRFFIGWALGTGIDLDPNTGLPYLSRERFGELYTARNGNKTPDF